MIECWQQLADFSDPSITDVDVKQRQQEWLSTCIQRNAHTRFGSDFGFGGIQSVDDYRAAVPLNGYDAFVPYVDSVAQGGVNELFAGPAIAFEKTSGSTSGQKLIPYSAESLTDFQRAIVPWLSSLARRERIRSGSAYWSISPAARAPEVTAGGVPIGLSDAAYLGEELIPLFLQVSAVPLWVGEFGDVRDWQLATLYYLLCQEDLVLISVWSPTFLVSLMDALDARTEEVGALLSNGGELAGHPLASDEEASVRLHRFLDSGATADLWPRLKLLSCWADGPSRSFAQALTQRFPLAALQGKGLLMTEGVVTTPDAADRPVLAPDSGFYEFLAEDGHVYLAHELTSGKRYEVVMTTAGGLYRYRTSDLVVCEGYSEAALPVLRFSGRELVSDMVGEKLADEFATSCLRQESGFAMLAAVKEGLPHYVLLLDRRDDAKAVIERVEARLGANPHYAYARRIGQLGKLVPVCMESPLAFYLNSPAHSGTLLGDVKVPALCLKQGIFDEHLRKVHGDDR